MLELADLNCSIFIRNSAVSRSIEQVPLKLADIHIYTALIYVISNKPNIAPTPGVEDLDVVDNDVGLQTDFCLRIFTFDNTSSVNVLKRAHGAFRQPQVGVISDVRKRQNSRRNNCLFYGELC